MSPMTRDELRSARARLGLSQVGLANTLGISRRTVEEWEAQKSQPPPYLRLALAALDAGIEPWKA